MDNVLLWCIEFFCLLGVLLPLALLIWASSIPDRISAVFNPDRVMGIKWYYKTRNQYMLHKYNRQCWGRSVLDKYHIYVDGHKVKSYKYWAQVVAYLLMNGYLFEGVGTDSWNEGYSVVELHPRVNVVRVEL